MRQEIARAFLTSARNKMVLAEEGDLHNPTVSDVVMGAIAYCDAVTAIRGGRVNSGNHSAAVGILRDVLGSDLPRKQESNFRNIIMQKEAAQYHARFVTLAEARAALAALEEFATWAEDLLGR